MDDTVAPEYPIDDRNKVRRRPERGAYDHATVHALMDTAMPCHIAYVIDAQPFRTPTFYCLTVTHLDSLVLGRVNRASQPAPRASSRRVARNGPSDEASCRQVMPSDSIRSVAAAGRSSPKSWFSTPPITMRPR